MPDEPMPPRLAAANWWVCSVRATDGRIERVVVVESHAYPDGTHVELNEAMGDVQIGNNALCTAVLGVDGQVVGLHPSRRFAPKAPPIWFVEVRESTASPPAVSLIAFTGNDRPPGTLVSDSDWSNLSVDTDNQLGAVRWFPATGQSNQLYVQPQWRRRNVASALLGAAECLSVARRWPRLWGDGQRTELGEQARNARTWQKRTSALTHLHPPMTPDDTRTDISAVHSEAIAGDESHVAFPNPQAASKHGRTAAHRSQ
jgi:GNAT superfamily N-acetyltransferase